MNRTGTISAGWASLTVGFGKTDIDPRVAGLIPAVGPNLAKVPLGTGDRLVLPINHKERHIIALVRLGLPGGIDPDRADHLDAVPALTIAQHFGIDVPPIQQMFFW